MSERVTGENGLQRGVNSVTVRNENVEEFSGSLLTMVTRTETR